MRRPSGLIGTTLTPVFDALSDRLDGIFSRLRNRGHMTERDVDEVSRELRVALLEADVNVRVARGFINRVKERAVGEELSKSLTPGQQFIKIVHEQLVETLGGTSGKLTMGPKPPTVVMLAGLQGSGKTTAAGKLARLLKSQGLHPLLVGADLQRPAAVEQLRVLAGRVDVPFYSEATDPVQRRARRHRRGSSGSGATSSSSTPRVACRSIPS